MLLVSDKQAVINLVIHMLLRYNMCNANILSWYGKNWVLSVLLFWSYMYTP